MTDEAGVAEELAYVESSLHDLNAERAAGDVSERDYARLCSRYEKRRDELLGELSALSSPVPPAQRQATRGRTERRLGTRHARLLTGWAAFASFAAAGTLVILNATGSGPFSPPPSLSVAARVQIMLDEASVLGAKGEVTAALATYDRVLALRPHQPEALADGGWLARLAGMAEHEPDLVRNGDAEVQAAVQLDPGSAAARAYDAVLLIEDRHEPRRSVAEFQAMLTDRPEGGLLERVRGAAALAFAESHLPLPRSIAAARGS